MAKIKLMQLLCPRRHCVTALAFDPETTTEESARETLKTFSSAFNAWCAICGSAKLRYETAETKYDSMREAAPHLAATAQKNAQTREFIEQLRKTAKNN